MAAPSFVTQKFAGIPTWGWAGIIGAAGGVVWVARRRAAGAKTSSGDGLGIDAYGPSPRGAEDNAGEGGGGGYGAGDNSSGTLQQILDALKNMQQQPTTPAGTKTPTPHTAPRQTSSPTVNALSPSTLSSFGAVVGSGNVSNPVSSTVASRYYTPSALDLATTQPGGLDFSLIVPTAKDVSAGQYSQVFTNYAGGTGPSVAPSNFITGERYDMFGRVIM